MSDIVDELRANARSRGGAGLVMGDVLLGAADEIERLRLALAEEQARYPEAYIREAEAQIERLRAPPTKAEVKAAAMAILGSGFYPEQPKTGWATFLARAALEAAAKVRGGK